MKVAYELNQVSRYEKLRENVSHILAQAGEKDQALEFSVFKSHSDSGKGKYWNVCHPDITSTKPLVFGAVRFTIDYWRVNDQEIISDVFHNPTWKDVIVWANQQCVRAKTFLFLESLDITHTTSECQFVEVTFGS